MQRLLFTELFKPSLSISKECFYVPQFIWDSSLCHRTLIRAQEATSYYHTGGVSNNGRGHNNAEKENKAHYWILHLLGFIGHDSAWEVFAWPFLDLFLCSPCPFALSQGLVQLPNRESFFNHFHAYYSPGPPASSLREERVLVLCSLRFAFLRLHDNGTLKFLKGNSHPGLPYMFWYIFYTWIMQWLYSSVYFQCLVYLVWNALFLEILPEWVLTHLTFYFTFLIMAWLKAGLTAFFCFQSLWVPFEQTILYIPVLSACI